MKHPYVAYLLAAAATVLLACGTTPARSQEPGTPKPLALRQIMKDMGRNMQEIVDAVAHEDWPRAARAAAAVAGHPEPPLTEKVRILALIGADAGKFRGFDEKSGRAAKALQEAAARVDGPAVIAAFADMQTACLGCHQSFRRPVVEHFYGKR
ncbi:MAG TPA: cytochrome c [Ramlibacter sp.]